MQDNNADDVRDRVDGDARIAAEQEGFELGTPALVCRWRLSGGMLPMANRHLRALAARSEIENGKILYLADKSKDWQTLGLRFGLVINGQAVI